MSVYYIVSNNGLFKQYYSENNGTDKESFVASLRNAKNFQTIDDAKKTIIEGKLENCIIIDQNGLPQN